MGTRLALALGALTVLILSAPLPGAAAGVERPPSMPPAHRPLPERALPPGPAGPEPQEDADAPEPAPSVRQIELHMPAGSDPTGLAGLIAVRSGGRLSAREIRRSIERLYATERLSDVVVRAVPAGPGEVDVVFEATPVRVVARVTFAGNVALPVDALRRAGRIEASQRLEYYPELIERLVQRMRVAYQRIGYEHVSFEHQLGEEEGQTVLGFRVREGEPTRIASVTVAGDPQLGIDEVLKTLGLGPGAVLNLDQLDQGVRALRARLREQRHYRARVSAPVVSESAAGAVVQLAITAGPQMEMRFAGNRTFKDAELREHLAYEPEEPLDQALIAQFEERIASWYRLQGFADARVQTREVVSPDGRAARVIFTVFEGEPLRVVQVRFEGNRHFNQEYLRDRLDESLRAAIEEAPLIEPVTAAQATELGLSGRESGRATPPWKVDATTVWFEPGYREAISRMMDLYRADGFLSAVLEMPLVERLDETRPDGTGVWRQARITIRVREGVQTRIASVAFPGAPDVGRIAGMVSVREGRPFNSLEVENSRMAVKRALGRDGYLYAAVNDRETFSADRRQVDVAFEIEPGPQVRVGRIMVQGLVLTRSETARGALAIAEEQILDPEALAESQRNLIRLGIFRNVSIRLNAPEQPDAVKDVYVAVEERNSANVTLGAGFSLVEGPRAFAEYNRFNLFGTALQLQARAKVNLFNASYPVLSGTTRSQEGFDAIGRRLNVGLQYPRVLTLLPLELGSRVDLVHERVIRPAYGFTRSAAIFGADWEGLGPVSASLQYEIESDEVQRTGTNPTLLSRNDIELLRFDEGTIHLHSIRPLVSLDFRDDPANPRKGAWFSGSAEFVQSLGGAVRGAAGLERPHSLFLKLTGQATAFVPLPRGAVFALALKGGRVLPFDTASRTIAPKRFFQGGATTMRGFRDDGMIPEDRRQALRDEVAACAATLNKTGCSAVATSLRSGEPLVSEGGELFTLVRGEVRYPLASQLEAVVFLDAGNLWLDQSKYDPLTLRYSTGAGLRLVTPVGPAAFDLGINLFPDLDLNESQVAFHFSIGVF